MTDAQTVGDRIKKRREELRISLNQLAEKSGVAKGYIWELENGTSKDARPSADTLFKIADALGTSTADLLGKRVRPRSRITIPPSLKAFAERNNLPESDVKMLAAVQYRGERPETEEDWQYIYESIRRTILGRGKRSGGS